MENEPTAAPVERLARRHGFRSIVVDGAAFQYAVSLSVGVVVVYAEDGARRELEMIPVESGKSWRGKHRDGGWGKRQVAELIRQSWK
jgi:hypothetical protein